MKIKKIGAELLAKVVLASAKKEADSACAFIGYQPKMPRKVKELKNRKNG